MLEIKVITLVKTAYNHNHFFFRIVVDDPRIFDQPSFLSAFRGMLRLRLNFEVTDV